MKKKKYWNIKDKVRVVFLWRDHLYHCELVPEDLPEQHLVPGHLPGLPEEAVQQHAQEAPKGSNNRWFKGSKNRWPSTNL